MGRVIIVDDRMQSGYRYRLTAPSGRNFDPVFRPDLTPKQMLELGVFCGKYLTDCRDEFPANWFARARLSSTGRDYSAGDVCRLLSSTCVFMKMAPRAGFEPATIRLTVECSTAELPGNVRSMLRREAAYNKASDACKAEMPIRLPGRARAIDRLTVTRHARPATNGKRCDKMRRLTWPAQQRLASTMGVS